MWPKNIGKTVKKNSGVLIQVLLSASGTHFIKLFTSLLLASLSLILGSGCRFIFFRISVFLTDRFLNGTYTGLGDVSFRTQTLPEVLYFMIKYFIILLCKKWDAVRRRKVKELHSSPESSCYPLTIQTKRFFSTSTFPEVST